MTNLDKTGENIRKLWNISSGFLRKLMQLLFALTLWLKCISGSKKFNNVEMDQDKVQNDKKICLMFS